MKLPPKPDAAMDSEVYKNFVLFKFKRADTGQMRSFQMYPGKPLDRAALMATARSVRIFTFNGRNYDMAILGYALAGAACADIKKLSDEIILGGLRPWDAERLHGFQIPVLDHVDLIEVVPGTNSLKIYGGKMHSRRMQDLPIEPDQEITPDQRLLLDQYCENDLDTTLDLRKLFLPQIELREKMSIEYGVDLRSKSDAQIAEAALKARISKLIGWRIGKPDIDIKSFRYKAPEWLIFSTPQMQQVLSEIQASTFYVEPSGKVKVPGTLEGRLVTIGRSTYKMGIGGLHSTEASAAHYSDHEWQLYDRDVASYYPAIIIQTQLYPQHLGKHFLHVYRDIRDLRIEAKKAKNKTVAETLKIVLNGSFGKFGNPYSTLYSPDLLIQVTITGQLALLMLIEALEHHDDIEVVAGNTDGIVIRCRANARDYMLTVIDWWEKATGFETEEVKYKALFSRSVNSYIALKDEGGVKLKGDYAEPKPVASSWPSPNNQVCVMAVCEYLEHGTNIEQFIRDCKDVRLFVNVRKVAGGGTWNGEYVGKAVRWIYVKGGMPMFYRKAHPKTGTHAKVSESDGCRPLMELPEGYAVPADIDYERYVSIAKQMLIDIGHTRPLPKVKIGEGRKKVEFDWG